MRHKSEINSEMDLLHPFFFFGSHWTWKNTFCFTLKISPIIMTTESSMYFYFYLCLHACITHILRICIYMYVFVYVFIIGYYMIHPMSIPRYPSGISHTSEQWHLSRGNQSCYPKQILLVSLPMTVGLDTGEPNNINLYPFWVRSQRPILVHLCINWRGKG